MLRLPSVKLLPLSLLSLGVAFCLNAQQSDHQRQLEDVEATPEAPREVEDLPEALGVEDGTLQFYFIEPVRSRNRSQLYLQTSGGFEVIRPSFASSGPLHRVNANSRIFFYERVRVQEGGQTTWQHIPRYVLNLEGYSGDKLVVFLPPNQASVGTVQTEVRPLRWVELSRDFYDFGEIALINAFEQPIAIQMDGQNVLLNPGQAHKLRFKMMRRQTGAVHVRIAMRFTDGDLQELFNTRVFIFENWRGILIPYFDAVNGELSLISLTEQPDG